MKKYVQSTAEESHFYGEIEEDIIAGNIILK
jgi:hypothetical protein